MVLMWYWDERVSQEYVNVGFLGRVDEAALHLKEKIFNLPEDDIIQEQSHGEYLG